MGEIIQFPKNMPNKSIVKHTNKSVFYKKYNNTLIDYDGTITTTYGRKYGYYFDINDKSLDGDDND